jgi:ferredoxin
MARPFYIDDEECIGDGSCADICPDCFSFEEGMTVARVVNFDCEEDLIEEAMTICPMQCIHWEEEN